MQGISANTRTALRYQNSLICGNVSTLGSETYARVRSYVREIEVIVRTEIYVCYIQRAWCDQVVA